MDILQVRIKNRWSVFFSIVPKNKIGCKILDALRRDGESQRLKKLLVRKVMVHERRETCHV
jgi:hypothetical protein